MGAGKKTKIIAGILGVAALAFLSLSGPVRESSGAGDVRPLFGEVKVQLSSGRYAQDSRMLTAATSSPRLLERRMASDSRFLSPEA